MRSVLVIFFSLWWVSGQSQSSCAGQAVYPLNVNEATALLRTTGNYWYDGFDPGHYVPNNESPQKATIFAGGLWMGGKDAAGNLKLSAVTFGVGSNSPYQPGPLNFNDGQPFPDGCQNWDRFFVVTALELQQHLDDLNDNGQIDGPVPPSILGWPGRGNPWFEDANGFALPNTPQRLAPFFDGDGDGIYDPQAGDYPLIKGDRYVWWVYNDVDQSGEGMGMEVQCAAYGFNSTDEALRYATFYEHTLIYRGEEPLDSFYTALWLDPDIGCSIDDYAGCLPDDQVFFFYNGQEVDDPCNGYPGFGTEVPVQAFKVLRSPKEIGPNEGHFDKFMYHAASTSVDPPNPEPLPAQTRPTTPLQHYYYMQGRWRDGSPLVSGGTGYDPNSTDVADHAFPGIPAEAGGWSMCQTDHPFWGMRSVTSFGPYELTSGEVRELDFALIFAPNQGACPDMQVFPELCASVEEAYGGTVTSNKPRPAAEIGLQVYPNPTLSEWTLEISGEVRLQRLRVHDSRGRLLQEIPLGGVDRRSFNWSAWSDGVYLLQVVLDDGQVVMERMIKQ